MRTKFLASVLCAMSAVWLTTMACQAATILVSSGPEADPLIRRCFTYLGKFHLLALHFPIALLLAAMVAQWRAVATGLGGDLTRALLWSGALAALVTAVLGWMFAYGSSYEDEDVRLIFLHRWLGTGTALLSMATLVLRNHLGPKSLAILLTLVAALLAATGHFGGSLSYGTDFFLEF